jgi:bifunctional oligoribonuclease and PAP phosphatase NrnA
MEIPATISAAIQDEFNKAKKVLFISHRNPDGDTIGSNIALRLFAMQTGKETASVCADTLHQIFRFLPLAETFLTDFRPERFDLIVSLDCGSPDQTVFLKTEPLALKNRPVINIDHHPSNTAFGDINLVSDTAASTTQIIFGLLKEWNAQISPQIATCLLAGLYTDTGSFMHSNTCDEVYEAAGELISLGAAQNLIVKNLFRQTSHEKLQLLGKILSGTNMTGKNVVISALREKDLRECGTDSSEMGGAIDYLNSVKGNRIAALLTEDGNGNIRGSLRTRHEDINLSDIAKDLGGGGHRKASGFTIKGHLQKEERWTVQPD